MIKKLNTYIQLSPLRKKMVIRALGLAVYSFVLFSFFKKKARFGTLNMAASGQQPPHPLSNDIAWAIRTASKYIFWKNVCRHQAYQAMALCNYYKIPCLIYIGLKKNITTHEIEAHAWTIAGGKIITGFCNPEEYTVQSIYSNKWQ